MPADLNGLFVVDCLFHELIVVVFTPVLEAVNAARVEAVLVPTLILDVLNFTACGFEIVLLIKEFGCLDTLETAETKDI